MKIRDNEYWKCCFARLEERQNKLASNSRDEIEWLYRQAVREIEGKVNTWYRKLGENGVSMAEARKPLSAAELREFKWDVHDYIKYGQDNALSGQWVKQLESFLGRLSVSKYDALRIQTRQSIESLFAKQSGIVSETMKEVYQSGFYHTAFEIQKGLGVGWDIPRIEQNQLEKIIAKPWTVDGKNFSERIWRSKQRLIAEIDYDLSNKIISKADPKRTVDAITDMLNAYKSGAGRIVMTEEAYFNSLAQKDCFDDLGVEEYEIVATLDSRTSGICQSMDGKRFSVKEFRVGVTAPPFHPWCRSTVCPCFDDFKESAGDGERYRIPDDLNYQDWKKAFVDGGDKFAFAGVDKSGNGDIIGITKNANGKEILIVEHTDVVGKPNSITQKESSKGGIERNYYDENGKQSKQIANNNHGKPKQHPYGKNGEHAHDYIYDESGNLTGRPIRELTDFEREENGDIL